MIVVPCGRSAHCLFGPFCLPSSPHILLSAFFSSFSSSCPLPVVHSITCSPFISIPFSSVHSLLTFFLQAPTVTQFEHSGVSLVAISRLLSVDVSLPVFNLLFWPLKGPSFPLSPPTRPCFLVPCMRLFLLAWTMSYPFLIPWMRQTTPYSIFLYRLRTNFPWSLSVSLHEPFLSGSLYGDSSCWPGPLTSHSHALALLKTPLHSPF